LIIEGKPGDVDFATELENSRRDPIHLAGTVDEQVALVGRIEIFVGTKKENCFGPLIL
jgi:hypothetical protein